MNPATQIDPPLRQLLRCPISRQPLEQAGLPPDLASAWSDLELQFPPLGNAVAMLVTADGVRAYPVWQDVIGLQPSFAVELASRTRAATPESAEKQQVARFYNEFGWHEYDDRAFNDAIAFEDMRELTAFYRRRCHRRVERHLTPGAYLLDVASGPVQIPEYVRYSTRFGKRVCIDLSLRGLLKAKQRLGAHAICIAGDITALPLRDGCMDSAVSVHTIYHVPAAEQSTAVAELYRVLKPSGAAVIVYAWGSAAAMYRWTERLREGLVRHGWLKPPHARPAVHTELGLYYSPHGIDWYQRDVAGRFPAKLRVWRSVEKNFLEWFARGPVSARLILWPLYILEELLPSLFGRLGVCPMFVIAKPPAP